MNRKVPGFRAFRTAGTGRGDAPYLPPGSSIPMPANGRPTRIRTNVLLFLATVATTIVAGALQANGPEAFASLGNLLSGVPFSAALLGILLAHEMGHYLTSRYYGVPASLPYFIPIPTIIGTMGAVIRMRAVIQDRRILFDIGIAGPLAGLLVALPATWIGLHRSQIVQASPMAGGIELGDSLLFMALIKGVFGSFPDNQTVLLHPVAFAGWLGFFVTSLNLLPMGQLDGGHVTYGIFGPGHRAVSRAVFVALLLWAIHGAFAQSSLIRWVWAFGFFCVAVCAGFSSTASLIPRCLAAMLGLTGIVGNFVPNTAVWVVWAVLMCFLRLDHPHTRDLALPLDPRRRALGWTALIVFLLTFTPQPFRELLP